MTLPVKISEEHVKSIVESATAQYWVVPGTTTTVCALTLSNGFTTLGLSACVVAENFNKELGEQYSLRAAKQKLINETWEREGWRLRCTMDNLPLA